ncbi:MAG: SgcJ/EcaC family oxidoreductase [Phycisphaerales bacterium]|nr:SgcJ/EcaC family oxidoreductase [Phycisphaerales bacterium]
MSCASTGRQSTTARFSIDDKADVNAIGHLLDQIAAADSVGDLDGVTASYTDDALLLPPDRPVLRGIDAIREHYQKLFDRYDLKVTIRSDEIHIAGDWAHSVGVTFVTSLPRTGGQAVQSQDKYMMLLKRTRDGHWKIHRLMWSPVFRGSRR